MTASPAISFSAQQALMASVLQNSLISLTLVDQDLNVMLSYQRQRTDHLAKPVRETVGRSVLQGFDLVEQNQIRAFYKHVFQGKSYFDTVVLPDGAQDKLYEVAYYPIRDDAGRIVAAASATRETCVDLRQGGAAGAAPVPATGSNTAVLDELSAEVRHLQEQFAAARELLYSHDKMAALGKLLAGIVHELNTPLGATKASGANLETLMADYQRRSARVFRQLDEQGFSFFDYLTHRANAANNQVLSTRDERRLVRACEQVLAEHGFKEAYETSQRIVAMGIHDGFQELAAYLKLPTASDVLDIVSMASELSRNIYNIQVAADKAKAIINTVKTYTRGSLAEEYEQVDLQESIQAILALYYNQMKYGVELDLNLEPGLLVTCNRDEMGQVWTNILQNALYAINNKGRIHISLTRVSNHAEIDITDNGPGIPPDLQHKIFEPFFTTKPIGEGAGIGLDLCNRIINKYGGKILLASEPGNTTFKIIMPLAE